MTVTNLILPEVIAEPEVFSYSFDLPYAPHVVVGSNVGQVKLYLPYNLMEFITLSNSGNLINTYSSTINGYYEKSGSQYQVRFSPFETPEYRRMDSGESYRAFTVNEIVSIHGDIMDSQYLDSVNYELLLIMFLILIIGYKAVFK